MEPHEKIYRSKKKIFIDNFVGGIAWGLGGALGLAIILALSGFIINNVNLVPFAGEFVAEVIKYIQNDPQLVK